MTKTGIYNHKKGGKYRVLFTAINATNGPDNGKKMVVYIKFPFANPDEIFTREESEFNEPGRFTLEEEA